MESYDFKNMSNNEIKLEMTKLEKSYEKLKIDIVAKIEEMKKLDKLYATAKEELNKRNSLTL